ncbi:hypothetical protein [Asticcacaulis sp.]|uniref:hypothetical protein n=1 Tax=Asticcacaulis sp. TaxID=1872648 RepID=UPI0031D2ECF6
MCRCKTHLRSGCPYCKRDRHKTYLIELKSLAARRPQSGEGQDPCGQRATGNPTAGRRLHYFNGKGGPVRNIDTSEQLLAATHVEGDTGDKLSGDGVDTIAIGADDTAHIWTDIVSFNMPSGSIGYYTTTTSAIRAQRDIRSTRGRAVPGTFGAW